MDDFEWIDLQEQLDLLRQNGFADLVDCFLGHEEDVYTAKGRLNKSAISRLLGGNPKQLEARLNAARDLLEGPKDFA